MLRAASIPFSVEKIHNNIVADLSRTIEVIGVFVADSDSESGKLLILYSAHNCPDTLGVSRDRLTTFISEGDVSGVDIATVAFEENKLAITADVIVSDSTN
jgi:hypothetical protein